MGGLNAPHYVAYPELVLSGYVDLAHRDYFRHLEPRSDCNPGTSFGEQGVGSIQGRLALRPLSALIVPDAHEPLIGGTDPQSRAFGPSCPFRSMARPP